LILRTIQIDERILILIEKINKNYPLPLKRLYRRRFLENDKEEVLIEAFTKIQSPIILFD